MSKVKSARHHWWPRCVSRHWADPDGLVGRLSPDGEVRRAPPARFGAIGNAHLIRLADEEDGALAWDVDFEAVFARADDAFPGLIAWLGKLDRMAPDREASRHGRFRTVDTPEHRLGDLVECLVSLAIRSPMNRETAVSVAEHWRGRLRGRERNAIIGLNMRNCQRMVSDSIGSRGKFAVLYAANREFVFGDGFFHNLASPSGVPMAPRILAPVTPEISVLYARPTRYRTEPRVVTLVLTDDEVEVLNDAVLVYARNEVFFRSQKPRMTESYRKAKHLRFTGRDHAIERLVHDLPGVSPLDLSIDKLLGGFQG